MSHHIYEFRSMTDCRWHCEDFDKSTALLLISLEQKRQGQVSRLFELLAIISTLEVFELSQNTHYLNLPTNYLNATNILNYLK